MLNNKIFSYLLLSLMLLLNTIGHSQIITSKKEAIKKGIYQKPIEVKKTEIVIEKPAKAVAVSDIKVKDPKTTKAAKPVIKSKKVLINDKEDNDLIFSPSENYLALQLINNAMSFVGVKYRGGGTSTSGMDCSGMVTAVFNLFDLKLPRSSIEMASVGQKCEPKDAKKGDLIFFKTRGRSVINHVGMVVEVLNDEIKFIHASTSNGVMISSTKEPYYQRAFAQINKVLQ